MNRCISQMLQTHGTKNMLDAPDHLMLRYPGIAKTVGNIFIRRTQNQLLFRVLEHQSDLLPQLFEIIRTIGHGSAFPVHPSGSRAVNADRMQEQGRFARPVMAANGGFLAFGQAHGQA